MKNYDKFNFWKLFFENKKKVWSIMYYNNFNIISVDTWNTPEIQDIVEKIFEHGYIYYCRWGDAPLQTIILSLYDHNRITKVNFKYSKRLQRESFKDDEGALHSFMPNDYQNNSCVVQNKK